jgi:hypothetical protein
MNNIFNPPKLKTNTGASQGTGDVHKKNTRDHAHCGYERERAVKHHVGGTPVDFRPFSRFAHPLKAIRFPSYHPLKIAYTDPFDLGQ